MSGGTQPAGGSQQFDPKSLKGSEATYPVLALVLSQLKSEASGLGSLLYSQWNSEPLEALKGRISGLELALKQRAAIDWQAVGFAALLDGSALEKTKSYSDWKKLTPNGDLKNYLNVLKGHMGAVACSDDELQLITVSLGIFDKGVKELLRAVEQGRALTDIEKAAFKRLIAHRDPAILALCAQHGFVKIEEFAQSNSLLKPGQSLVSALRDAKAVPVNTAQVGSWVNQAVQGRRFDDAEELVNLCGPEGKDVLLAKIGGERQLVGLTLQRDAAIYPAIWRGAESYKAWSGAQGKDGDKSVGAYARFLVERAPTDPADVDFANNQLEYAKFVGEDGLALVNKYGLEVSKEGIILANEANRGKLPNAVAAELKAENLQNAVILTTLVNPSTTLPQALTDYLFTKPNPLHLREAQELFEETACRDDFLRLVLERSPFTLASEVNDWRPLANSAAWDSALANFALNAMESRLLEATKEADIDILGPLVQQLVAARRPLIAAKVIQQASGDQIGQALVDLLDSEETWYSEAQAGHGEEILKLTLPAVGGYPIGDFHVRIVCMQAIGFTRYKAIYDGWAQGRKVLDPVRDPSEIAYYAAQRAFWDSDLDKALAIAIESTPLYAPLFDELVQWLTQANRFEDIYKLIEKVRGEEFKQQWQVHAGTRIAVLGDVIKAIAATDRARARDLASGFAKEAKEMRRNLSGEERDKVIKELTEAGYTAEAYELSRE